MTTNSLSRLLRSRSGRLHPGCRLAAFTLMICVGAGTLTVMWIGLGLPPQRSHGISRALPLLASGVLVLSLAVGVTWMTLRRLEGRGLATVGLARDHGARGWVLGIVLGAVTPLLVVIIFGLTGHAGIGWKTTTSTP